ncbi:MAG: hypothetical protein R6U98_10670 [Pirellulaceae bacterium]
MSTRPVPDDQAGVPSATRSGNRSGEPSSASRLAYKEPCIDRPRDSNTTIFPLVLVLLLPLVLRRVLGEAVLVIAALV